MPDGSHLHPLVLEAPPKKRAGRLCERDLKLEEATEVAMVGNGHQLPYGPGLSVVLWETKPTPRGPLYTLACKVCGGRVGILGSCTMGEPLRERCTQAPPATFTMANGFGFPKPD